MKFKAVSLLSLVFIFASQAHSEPSNSPPLLENVKPEIYIDNTACGGGGPFAPQTFPPQEPSQQCDHDSWGPEIGNFKTLESSVTDVGDLSDPCASGKASANLKSTVFVNDFEFGPETKISILTQNQYTLKAEAYVDPACCELDPYPFAGKGSANVYIQEKGIYTFTLTQAAKAKLQASVNSHSENPLEANCLSTEYFSAEVIIEKRQPGVLPGGPGEWLPVYHKEIPLGSDVLKTFDMSTGTYRLTLSILTKATKEAYASCTNIGDIQNCAGVLEAAAEMTIKRAPY